MADKSLERAFEMGSTANLPVPAGNLPTVSRVFKYRPASCWPDRLVVYATKSILNPRPAVLKWERALLCLIFD